MKSNVVKLGMLGLGVLVVSKLLGKVATKPFAPVPRGGARGGARGLQDADPLATALGCACDGATFGIADHISDEDDAGTGLGFKKLKKAFKKAVSAPAKVVKKAVAVVKKDVKKVAKQAKRDVKAVAKPVVRDFRKAGKLVKKDFSKAAKLVKTDFKKAGQLFGGKKSGGGDAGAAPEEPIKTEYYDSEGRLITQAEYEALMKLAEAEEWAAANAPVATPPIWSGEDGQFFTADELFAQQEAEYGFPGTDFPGAAVQGDDWQSGMFSADDLAAQVFQQDFGTDGSQTQDVFALSYPFERIDQTGFADGTVPYTGSDLWQQSEDPWAAQWLPPEVQRDTWDAYGASVTSDDSLIMPMGEPSVPFSADELMLVTEYSDAPEGYGGWSGYGYSHPRDVPSYYDDAWGIEGLGALVVKPPLGQPGVPQRVKLAMKSWMRPSTYGFWMTKPSNPAMLTDTPSNRVKPGMSRKPRPQQRPHQWKPHHTMRPQPILADRKGNAYVKQGGSLHRLGSIDALAGGVGLGCVVFGRDMRGGLSDASQDGLGFSWGKFRDKLEKGAKKVATYTTPSGFAYSRLKKMPKLYKEFRVVAKQATPYLAIAGGTALTVASLGTASAAGVAAIAAGVAELGAQGYKDVQERKAEKALDRAIEEQRVAEAIASNNVIAQSPTLTPSSGPAPGEIPGGDFPWEYPGDGVVADFLDIVDSFAS